MMFLRSIVTLLLLAAAPVAAAELVMVESQSCFYCKKWHSELGHIYPKTAEAQIAPMVFRDISEPAPEGTTFSAPVVFTPTFVLIEDGKELGRFEGYPGDELFWWMLGSLLKEVSKESS